MSRSYHLSQAKQARKRKRDQRKRKDTRRARNGTPAPKTLKRAEANAERRKIALAFADRRPFHPQLLAEIVRERMRLSMRRSSKRPDPWAKAGETPEGVRTAAAEAAVGRIERAEERAAGRATDRSAVPASDTPRT